MDRASSRLKVLALLVMLGVVGSAINNLGLLWGTGVIAAVVPAVLYMVHNIATEGTLKQLLAHDPFHGRPPRYVRGVLYQYRFADPAARRVDRVWWSRERVGDYSPVLSLDVPRTNR